MNETITCDSYGCETVIADDLGNGWVKVRGTLYLNPDTGNLFCEAHGYKGDDIALEDEVDLTRSVYHT